MKTKTTRTTVALLSLAVLGATALTQGSAAVAAPMPAGRYIVSTKSTPATAAKVQQLRTSGTSVTARYSHVLNGFSGQFTAQQVRLLKADPAVTSITRDVRISVSDTRTLSRSQAAATPWGLDRIDQRATTGNGSYRYDTTGKGVTAFVVDSGIRLNQADFGTRARSGYDFVDSDMNASDCAGHGTHVAGTIGGTRFGVAKQVQLVSVRVFDCEGEGYMSDFISALDWVVAHRPSGPAVVNFSGGGPAYAPADTAVANTVKAGIPVVIAAGNDATPACGDSPGRVPQALTVAASDINDREAYFSDYGSCVDLFAPGVDIVSDSNASTVATETMSGTSMAAPHATGAVARYLQNHPQSTPSQVFAALVKAATPNTLRLTNSSPNRLLYLATPGAAYTPTNVRLTRTDAKKSVTVTWSASASPAAKVITGYQVTRQGKEANGKPSATANVSGTARSYTFTKLRAGTSYRISVRALTSTGPGDEVAARTTLTAIPGKVRIKAATAGSRKDKPVSIRARWLAPKAGGPVAAYRVRVRDSKTHQTTTVTRTAHARSAKVTGLKRGHHYVAHVQAVNPAGTGAWSKASKKVTAR
jgi:subtilisin family serine protease